MNPNLDELLKQTDRVMNSTERWPADLDSISPPKVHVGVDGSGQFTYALD